MGTHSGRIHAQMIQVCLHVLSIIAFYFQGHEGQVTLWNLPWSEMSFLVADILKEVIQRFSWNALTYAGMCLPRPSQSTGAWTLKDGEAWTSPYSGGEMEVSPELAEQKTLELGLGLGLHESKHIW